MANIPFLNNAYFAAKVGIGTASPGNPLHVYSSDNILATFESTDGISEIRIKDNTKYTRLLTVGGHFKIMPNDGVEMAVFQGDTGRTLFNAGNVGIGTTTPNASLQIGHAVATSSEKLDVRGNSSGNYIASFEQDHITGYGVLIDTDGTLVSEPALKIKNQSSELFYVGSNGNVGIGTTSPNYKLTVTGDAGFSNWIYASKFYPTSSTTDILMQTGTGRTITLDPTSTGKVLIPNGNVGIGTTSPGSKLHVQGTSFFFDQAIFDDKVGIGTTAPSQKLHISGNMRLTGAFRDRLNSQGAANYVLTSTGSNGTQWVDASGSSIIGGPYLPLAGGTMTGDLKLNDAVVAKFGTGDDLRIQHTGNQSYIQNYTGDLQIQNRAADKDILFRADDGSGVVTSYLVLDGSTTHAYFSNPGNVGIGTTSPSQKLQVDGSIKVNANGFFGPGGTVTTDGIVSIDGGSGTGGEAYLRLMRGGTSGFILNHTATAIQVRATANIPMFFYTNDTIGIKLNANSTVSFPEYAAGYLKTDASGNITADNTGV